MSSDDRNTGQAAGSAGAKSTAATWGEGLSYPEWMTRLLPAVHDVFTAVNKYVSVPALKMGLGRYMSNPAPGRAVNPSLANSVSIFFRASSTAS